MKKTLLSILLVLIIAQLPVEAFQKKKYPESKTEISRYEALWIEVNKLENENQTSDALSVVEEIFISAKKENNVPQTIKSLLFKGKYQNTLKEDSELLFINLLKKEIERSIGEEKALLQSLLAETYAMYFNRNQYKFYNRTAVSEKEKLSEDFRTWDLQSIYDEITTLYLASVKEKDLLLNTPLKGYKDILDNVTEETLLLRPTLYDFLVNRAIDFFSTKSILIEEPANAFKLDKIIYLEEADVFNEINFEEVTQYRNHLYYATILYQDILRYRFEGPDVEAYLSAELNRLKFVRDNFVGEKKDFRFRVNLQQIIAKHPGNKMTSVFYYELCKSLKDEIAEEDKDNITYNYVLQLCDRVIKDYPGTIGANNCLALKEEILRKDLSLQMVKYVAPNEPLKALVKYKNLNSIYCNIVKLTDLGKDFGSLKQEDKIKKLNALPSAKKWRLSLPEREDYRYHSVEIPLNALPPGDYVLLVSDNKDFNIKEQAVTTTFFTASSISYVLKNNSNNGSYDVYVLDRTSGLPLSNAKVKTFYSEYDYNLRKHVNKEGETKETDKNGFVNIKELKNRSVFFEITHGEEKLNTGSPHYFYFESPYIESVVTTTQFFTDRSIYRPGQTVYFKAILTEYNKGENTALNGKRIKVNLRDVNYKEISTLELISNQFGAVDGSFTLPISGLTGSFTLQSELGSTSIQVEEYKRPTFEVKIDKPTISYIIEENVKIKGNASTYFGAPVSEGAVKYRVVRKTHFPTPRRYGWWIPFPKPADKEITYGEVKTDKEGNFEIVFEAIPDHSINKTLMPVFTYHITADITDLGGETRSAEQFVRVGYVGLLADVITPETWKIEEKNQFQVVTTNLDGEDQNAQVQVKIHKIKSPEKVKIKRYWEMPDSYLMSEEEHHKLFPNEEYKNENDPLNWVLENLVFSETFFTKEKNKVEFFPNSFSEPGVYRLDLLCETTLFPIEISKIIKIEASDSKQLVFPEALKLYLSKPLKEGEQSFDYKIASSLENALAIIEVNYDGKVLEREFIALNNEAKTLTFKLSDEHKGRVDIQAFLIKNNRQYTQVLPVNIPKPSKELQVEWTTFRDKMQPGKKEVWRLKIKGPNGEKVAAELLATMYDASLDAFLPHNFSFNLREKYNRHPNFWKQDNFNTAQSQLYGIEWNKYSNHQFLSYPSLNLFGFSFYGYNYMMYRGNAMYKSMGVSESSPLMSASQVSDKDTEGLMDMDAGREEVFAMVENLETKSPDQSVKQPLRTNLQETAFFFPNLLTDKEGNVILEFTTPEALTKWKLLGFALDEKLNSALFSKEAITQKELMVIPHLPRFLREKDEITLTAKVFNITDKSMKGKANIKLINALANQDITAQIVQNEVNQSFELAEKGSMAVSWTIKVPEGLQAVNYEIFASSGSFEDGEGGFLPVLTNRMLVTETLPMQVLGNQTKNYVLEKLKNNTSKTLKNHQLTLEITENPVWYAIQALPYLMEYPYECAEQTFNRLYANAIAGHVVQSNPAIKRTFDLWNSLPDSKALLSNLEKNQELKMLLIEETPWLRTAQSESEQKKRIALLFDMNKMGQEQARAMSRIVQMQTPNGGFSWFPGMPDNRYITQYIVSGYAHLVKLGVVSVMENTDLKQSIQRAIEYLDARIVEDLNEIKKQKDYLENDHLGYYSVQYLYARTYFPEIKMNKKTSEAHLYFKNQAKQYWISRGEQLKSMIAIALNKTDEKAIAQKIIESLRQNAINSEEKGMYWKSVEGGGYYWYNAGIETQALIIEAFDEVGAKPNEINAMKLWLLKQKQVQRWSSTKATAEACYVLLLRGSDWLSEERQVEIVVGNHKISSSTVENKEPGTGYFKQKWDGDKITPNMGDIKITGKGESVSWGALYWQYFEDLDKITPAQTPLSLSKELYKEVVTEKGVRLEKVEDTGNLKVGDKVKVRIILKSDRNMEFIHLKDMRSAGFEPINVLSTYKRQDGLGYYESTRDAATNFFIDYLPKGIYVFEYPLRVSHKGDFSNGITSVQSMYASEFAAHSEGVRVKVVE